MTTSTKILLISILVFLLLSCCSNAYSLKACKIDKLYQFGDFMLDTGNAIHEIPNARFSYLPYGQSLSKAMGHCSDGLLMIDYLALEAGLTWLNPYLDKNAPKDHGVNFAVAGATALPFEVLSKKNIISFITNTSLDHQIDWMSFHFNSICHKTQCKDKLKNALFIVGEIGGNDYNFGLLRGQTLQKIKGLTLEVVQVTKRAVEKAISYGATRIIIPGNFPVGCFPFFLTVFPSNDTNAYHFHCLKDYNDLAIYHNKQIKKIIKVLRKEHPHIIIVYGDYYNAFLWILQHASELGFDKASLQKSSCGVGGNYNYDLQNTCGPETPVCPNPNDHLSWDGSHLTQNAYKFITYWIINNIFPKLKCIV